MSDFQTHLETAEPYKEGIISGEISIHEMKEHLGDVSFYAARKVVNHIRDEAEAMSEDVIYFEGDFDANALMEATGLPEDEFVIKRGVANKVETPTGPRTQIKVEFYRKNAEARLFDPIQPVVIKSTRRYSPPVPVGDDERKILFFGDSQNSFISDDRGNHEAVHDRRALDLMVQIAKKERPTEIVILGDMLDLTDWSDKYVCSPEMQQETQRSLVEMRHFLERIRNAAPKANIVYLEGNHEVRLKTAIIKNTGAAYGLKRVTELDGYPTLSIPSLLQLDDLDIEWIGAYPDGEHWVTDNVRFVHGSMASSTVGGTAAKYAKESIVTTIFGHIHRQELVSITSRDRLGNYIRQAFSAGTLARIDAPVVAGATNQTNWQQGAGLLYVSPVTQIVPILIKEGTCLVNNNVYVAESHDKLRENLINDTNYTF